MSLSGDGVIDPVAVLIPEPLSLFALTIGLASYLIRKRIKR
ncbi:MAG: PEP-CTERM sorting domain-containing protein [Candidatus Auribacterota bacterium]